MASTTGSGCTSSGVIVPAQQQAIVQLRNGGPEVLELQTVPVLEPGADQVLIRVRAAAVNPVDWKIREGYAPFPTNDRRVPGFDVAGDVVKLGADVTTLESGDAVFSMIGMLKIDGLNGGYSEYAVAPASNTLRKPDSFSYAEAAALGTAGIAAARALDNAKLEDGERVFINGISGSVGTSAAQIALAMGATVIGTASERHHDFLRSLGVAQLVDYRTSKFVDVVEPVDVYVETVNKDHAAGGLAIVREGGRLVSVVGVPDADACGDSRVTCIAIGGPPGAHERSEPEYLGTVANLAAAGRLRTRVDTLLPLAQAAEAQERVRRGGTQGKVILVVGADDTD